jgi:hypothetical protein
MAFYNYKTGLSENKNDTYWTQTEASKNKWSVKKVLNNSKVIKSYVNINLNIPPINALVHCININLLLRDSFQPRLKYYIPNLIMYFCILFDY